MKGARGLFAGAFLVVSLILSSALVAQDAPSLSLSRIDSRPVIDGDLSDACWETCEPVSFVRFPNGEKPTYATRARAATDGTWLFVAYDCEDPSLKPDRNIEYRVDAPVTSEDCVELFVDPGTDGRVYFHFAADRFGQQQDKRGAYNEFTKSYVTDILFNMHWRAAGKPTANGYAVEMAVPLFYFKREQADSSTWRINFCRHEQDPARDVREWSEWARTTETFHSPSQFGRLTEIPQGEPEAVFLPVMYGVRIGVMSALGGDNEYPVLVGLRNDSVVSGQVHVTVTDLSSEKPEPAHDEDLQVGARTDRVAEFDMVTAFMKDPQPEVVLTLKDDLGLWRASMTNLMGRFEAAEKTLDAYLDRNYYTTEEAANLCYTILRSEQEIETLSLDVAVTDADGGTLFEQSLDRALPLEQSFAIPLADVPVGTHTAKLRVRSQGGQPLEETSLELIKREPLGQGNEVKVDRYNRCVRVNGEPFFPFGPVSLAPPEKLPWMARVGFNVCLRWGGGYEYDVLGPQGKSPAEAVRENPLLNLAQEHGMLVIDRFRSYTGMSGYKAFRSLRSRQKGQPTDIFDKWFGMLEALVPHVKHHPAFFGVCPFDEPKDMFVGDKPYAELSRDVADAMDRLDGYHPTFNNFNYPVPLEARWKDHQDLYSYYDYWQGPQKGGEVTSFRTAVCSERAEADHKPLFIMPQSGELGSEPLLPEEQRANTYTMLVGGARGLYYFTWPISHQATYDIMQTLASEVKALAPALTRRRPRQEIVTQGVDEKNRVVDAALLVTPDEEVIFLLANRSYSPVDVTYRFDWLDDENELVRMFGPKTTLPIRDRAASEHLDLLEVRAYKIRGYRRTDPKQLYRVVIEETHTGPERTRELIVNGGFEQDANWKLEGKNAKYDASQAHSGDRSLRLERDKEDSILIVYGRPIELKKGHRYRMEGYVKLDAEEIEHRKCGVLLMVNMPAGSENKYACGGISESATEWVHVTRELNIVEDVKASPQFRLRNIVGVAWVDDFSVTDLGMPRPPTQDSKNLVPNSSFEQDKLEQWPVRWRQNSYYDFGDSLIGSDEQLWGTDDRYAVHGEVSLLMTGSPSRNMTRSWYQRYNAGMDVKDGTPYTFSVYMRSDRPGTVMNVDVREIGNETWRLTTDWKRYTMTGTFKETALNNSTTAINFTMETSDPSVHVWIDAVQLEEGPEATEYVLDGYRRTSVFDDAGSGTAGEREE